MTRCDVSEQQGLQAADPWGGGEEQGLRREDFYSSILLLNTTWLNFILLREQVTCSCSSKLGSDTKSVYVCISVYLHVHTHCIRTSGDVCTEKFLSSAPSSRSTPSDPTGNHCRWFLDFFSMFLQNADSTGGSILVFLLSQIEAYCVQTLLDFTSQ